MAQTFLTMADSKDRPRHNLRLLSRTLFELSKTWWTMALLLRLGVFIVGVIVVLFGLIPLLAPFLIAILSIVAEIFLWQSNRVKDTAETLLRKLDLQDSFGWTISNAELSDLLVRTAHGIRKQVSVNSDLEDGYFASTESVGPRRALETIQESAWYSKHLAQRTGYIYFWITCVAVAISVVVLIVSIETIRNFDVLSNIGRVVTSAILLIFSLGLIRSIEGYYSFSRKSEFIEESTKSLLHSGDDDPIQAIKLVYEYQLARASAPLIPTWVWNMMRDTLNDLWKEYRQAM